MDAREPTARRLSATSTTGAPADRPPLRRRLRAPRGLGPALAIAAVLLAAHAASVLAAHAPAWPTGPDLDTLVSLGARADAPLAAGEIDRLLTAVFLHDGLTHAAMNALWTALLLILLRHQGVATAAGVAAWVLTGAVSMAASWAYSPGVTVGALGAVFGLLGWMAVTLSRRLPPGRRALPLGLVLVAVGAPSAAGAVDLAAHAGGAAAGVALGLLPWRWTARRTSPLTLLAAAALLAAAGLRAVHVEAPARLVSSPTAGETGAWRGAAALTRPARRRGDAPLPALGTPGAWRGGRCVPHATPGPAELDCQQLAGAFLALSGPWERLRAATPDAPRPPGPGRCARATEGGQTAVTVRGGPSSAQGEGGSEPSLVFAALSSQWAGYAPIWRALTADRCPGIGSRGPAPRRGPRGSGRRRRGPRP